MSNSRFNSVATISREDGEMLAIPAHAARQVLMDGIVMARALASTTIENDRLAFARTVIFSVVSAYWDSLQRTATDKWPMVELAQEIELVPLSESAKTLALTMGRAAATMVEGEASFLVGTLYTEMIPSKTRSEYGVYYTPPALCERLLDMVTQVGVDWRSARVLDPACGGGAFLAPVSRRMLKALEGIAPESAVMNIVARLVGYEVDPFAAWMSQVFVEATLDPLCRAAGVRLPILVEVCDSCERLPKDDGFDLVVGNPPYGRITLSPKLRERYRRSLYGHANLYGVFTDIALRFASPGGIIGYVTPTSFLAGEYFKALRGLLAREAPPAAIDFIMERRGVFADVLQETLLAVYRRGGQQNSGEVHFISAKADATIKITSAGTFALPAKPDRPWLIPRSETDTELIRAAKLMPHRLRDYGYKVSTGPLVWNRHRESLRDSPGVGRFPLIWAESVRPNGTFVFRAEKRNHVPYFEPTENERWVVTSFPCVLLQRTTAKEQDRRLIAAELPQSFIGANGAVVVENHLNMVRPVQDQPGASTAAIAALLNTKVLDDVFRCINGSVAVSAYEVEALPLPPPDAILEIEKLVRDGGSSAELEKVAWALYGVSWA